MKCGQDHDIKDCHIKGPIFLIMENLVMYILGVNSRSYTLILLRQGKTNDIWKSLHHD